MTFDEMFTRATNIELGPFPFQRGFALYRQMPTVIRVPTGLGKTAMLVLGWLWRRRFEEESIRRTTPRRLIYCLPMRVLVEQTRNAIKDWLGNLSLQLEVEVHVLMGGEQADDWDLHPERDAILIGTQDMLLSRALNRGYGMSRFRWPMHFGLLNNDCLWAFDEVQLMDAGAATSAQLEAFRRIMGTVDNVQSVWMSATLEPDWLHTVDFQFEWVGKPLKLSDEDKKLELVRDRRQAIKPLQKCSVTMGHSEAIADAILSAHQPGTRTLAVFNTVERAMATYRQIRKQSSVGPVLIHSRFRPPDREQKMRQLLADPPAQGTLAITTQVVEAGVDVSARTLFAELAPWASMVQRFGRCNRKGEFNRAGNARVYWIDTDEEAAGKFALPYKPDELADAREHLQRISDAGPASLEKVKALMKLEPDHVIRRRDLLDLFDTTPDLAGNDLDISRFIRSDEELDVQVFWRDVPKDTKVPEPEQDYGKAPRRRELCPVPVYGKQGFREFVKRKRDGAWRWDPLERKWCLASQVDVYAGQVFLVRSDAGGYDSDIGWNLVSKRSVDPVELPREAPEAYDGEPQLGTPWQTIAEHTDDVVEQLNGLIDGLQLSNDMKQILIAAARWHDWGKVHEVFQDAIFEGRPRRNGGIEPKRPDPWRGRLDIGKAPDRKSPINFWGRYRRPHFRHELASALGILVAGLDDIVVYLVAAHHGKVRLSIRSLPGEKAPEDDTSRLYARGVWDGDELSGVDLGGGVAAPPVTLSLECMQLGRSDDRQASWTERMLKLREKPELGPFRLAYLEALLRAADMRASRLAAQHAVEQQGIMP